jgi:hypothetical protein
MTLMDYPIDARFRAIEDRLVAIERDLAVIKTRLDALPTKWMFIVFAASLIVPLYALVGGLLYFVLK